jgi:uncharacterized protein YlxW (UPF0749 family)
MQIDASGIALAIAASVLSGFSTALVSHFNDNKKEKVRRQERYQDQLKIEIKDLKIQLYELERNLSEWKDKYYSAIQELISVKSELEETLIKLSLINLEIPGNGDSE